MLKFASRLKKTFWYKTFSIFIASILSFSLTVPPSFAQLIPNLPAPGTMVRMSPGFTPAIIRGMKIFADNPLQFDFIVDRGDSGLKGEALKSEGEKLIKYFMAALTVPEKELWVNLSPYEEGKIIPQSFGITDMGRDLLAQDYILKQLTSSLMYPEDALGKKFWDRVYKKANELFGTTDIPINTFNKVWIVPDKAVVYEQGDMAFIAESHMKVMLEEDYLSMMNNLGSKERGTDRLSEDDVKTLSNASSQIVKEILIPEIEKEVNEGKNFAGLRQIYNSMILATWYKVNLKESLLGKVYVDQNKTKGIDIEDKDSKEKIYQQYLEAFKKGVYNYIKEDVDPATEEVIPRKYFSGGFDGDKIQDVVAAQRARNPAMLAAVSPAGVSNIRQFEQRLAAPQASGDEQIVSMRSLMVENLGSGKADLVQPTRQSANQAMLTSFFNIANVELSLVPVTGDIQGLTADDFERISDGLESRFIDVKPSDEVRVVDFGPGYTGFSVFRTSIGRRTRWIVSKTIEPLENSSPVSVLDWREGSVAPIRALDEDQIIGSERRTQAPDGSTIVRQYYLEVGEVSAPVFGIKDSGSDQEEDNDAARVHLEAIHRIINGYQISIKPGDVIELVEDRGNKVGIVDWENQAEIRIPRVLVSGEVNFLYDADRVQIVRPLRRPAGQQDPAMMSSDDLRYVPSTPAPVAPGRAAPDIDGKLFMRDRNGTEQRLKRIGGFWGMEIFAGTHPSEVIQVREAGTEYELSDEDIEMVNFLADIGIAPRVIGNGSLSHGLQGEDIGRFQFVTVERIEGPTPSELADIQGSLTDPQRAGVLQLLDTLIARRIHNEQLTYGDGNIRGIKIGRKFGEDPAVVRAYWDNAGLGSNSGFNGSQEELAKEYLKQIAGVRDFFKGDPEELSRWEKNFGFIEQHLISVRDGVRDPAMMTGLDSVGPEDEWGSRSWQQPLIVKDQAMMAEGKTLKLENIARKAIETAFTKKRVQALSDERKAAFIAAVEAYAGDDNVRNVLAREGVDIDRLADIAGEINVILVDDVQDNSPVIAAQDADNYEFADIGLSFNNIYVGRGLAREFFDTEAGQELFNVILFKQLAAFAKAKSLSGPEGNNYDEAAAQGRSLAKKVETVLVQDRLQQRVQETVKHFIELRRPIVQKSMQDYFWKTMRAHGVELTAGLDNVPEMHRQIIEKAVTLPLAKQRKLFNDYRGFVSSHERSMRLFGFGQAMAALAPRTDFYSDNYYTSFSEQELAAVDYLREYKKADFDRELLTVLRETPVLTDQLTHLELMSYVAPAVNRLLDSIKILDENGKEAGISKDVRIQATDELTVVFYSALLRRDAGDDAAPKRDIRISDTTIRDGPQSNNATNMRGYFRRKTLERTLQTGVASRFEGGGGAHVEVDTMKGRGSFAPFKVTYDDNGKKLTEAPPESNFHNILRQSRVLRDALVRAIGSEMDRIDPDDQAKLFDRYERKPGRKILSDQELKELLSRTRLSPEAEEKVKYYYGILQESLERGQYIVTLTDFPDDVLKEFMEVYYMDGNDVFRIFDATNNLDNIENAVRFARETGALVQPAITYGTKFPGGIAKYVEIAKELVRIAGDSLDTLVVKDVGGLLKAEQAYELARAIREAGITAPLQLHTHDTRGNRIFTVLEFARGSGDAAPITVDTAIGKLSAPLAQPNLRKLAKVLRGTKWEGALRNLDEVKLEEAEGYIAGLGLGAQMSTEMRLAADEAEIPAGMLTNFEINVVEQMQGTASFLEKEYRRNFFGEGKKLTEEGTAFKNALLRAAFAEIPNVHRDIDGIPLGTPTSDWVGKQALSNVMQWVRDGALKFRQNDEGHWEAFKTTLFKKDRLSQYGAFWPGVQNFLIQRAQSLRLADLYPNVNRDLIHKAFGVEGLMVRLNDQGLMEPNPIFSKYDNLRVVLGKKVFDLPTIRTLKIMAKGVEAVQKAAEHRSQGKITDADFKKIQADNAGFAEAMENRRFSRKLVLDIAVKNPSLSISPTVAEVRGMNSELKKRYPAYQGTREDALLFILFGQKPTHAPHLFQMRQRLLEMHRGDGVTVPRAVLEFMGIENVDEMLATVGAANSAMMAGDSKRTVIVVDDEAAARAVTRRILQNQGFEVIEAGDGDQVERLLQENPGVRMVVSDLQMIRMSGDALASRLQETHPGIPVIITTGTRNDGNTSDEALQAGRNVQGVLRKPYGSDELGGLIDKILGASPAMMSGINNLPGQEEVGGIDLNPALLDLQIKRDGNGVPLPLLQQPIGDMKIEGFLPVIIKSTPVTNLPLLSGVEKPQEKVPELSRR